MPVPVVSSCLWLKAMFNLTPCGMPVDGRRRFERSGFFAGEFIWEKVPRLRRRSAGSTFGGTIENVRALDKLEHILEVEGLDAIMIGPYDLSSSMGLTGLFDHPKFIEATELIPNLSKGKS